MNEERLKKPSLTSLPLVRSITLPRAGRIDLNGLILIVGPNSCGKTQLIQDIHQRITGQPRNLVVALEVEITRPESIEAILETLKAEGYVVERWAPDGNLTLFVRVNQFGLGGPSINSITKKDAEASFKNFDPAVYAQLDNQRNTRALAFLQQFGGFFVTSLFLENRLNNTRSVGAGDWDASPPTHDMHALHLHESAAEEFTSEIHKVFGKRVWMDPSRMSTLCFRVSEDAPEPDPVKRTRLAFANKYRTIESEGDGIRSYAAICMALLLGQRPLCVIDEPELCLHPPQAYKLGEFIGRHTAGGQSTTIVATHSSHLLRGILETGARPQIIRLSRVSGHFAATKVSFEKLTKSVERASVRAETVFDGIFSDAVVIVESENDRALYQTAADVAEELEQFDVLYLPVGGTGGMYDPAAFFSGLRIPIAIIADLDLVLDADRLRNILAVLKGRTKIRQILALRHEAARLIKLLPPALDEGKFNSRLMELSKREWNWKAGDESVAVNELRELERAIRAKRRLLKEGGMAALSHHPEIQALVDDLVKRCAEVGLFMVPVGELEFWCLDLMKDGPSRRRKTEWTTAACQAIRKHPAGAGDVIEFVCGVRAFLRAERFRAVNT